ncbi:MAG TPA: carboxypeptidase regulatory-like domain-containing protein [Terracidiphilus sp.]|nr:carboxypeptidase regulatory-like domain-containing protein [Terracidiphilus sp.]
MTHFVLALALSLAGALAAEGQAAAPAAQAAQSAATAALRGHITDPSGALIPGTEIKVSTAAGQPVKSATADAAGGYQVRGLPAGSYVIEADYQGFATFVSSPISLNPGQTRIVDIKMAIEAAQQQVVVSEEGNPQVSVEAGENANAIVIKGKDLDALSDDPDELSSELQALAGPAAGPNGGQIYIDGFTAGELPPKSAIREIRINQNPFSAEFDKLGYGRIEIFTKPGSDKLHGRAFIQGNDDSFNSGNPFTTVLPSYHSVQYNGTVSGPINKSASYFFSAEDRQNQNDSVYQATTAALDPSGLYAQNILSGSVFSPATHTNISPRIDVQLGQKNTLTLRYQFYRNHLVNSFGESGFGFGGSGGSSVSLPTVATDSDTIEHTFQLEDSQVINDRMVNETRIQYLRDISTVTPLSGAPNISVPGYFVSGGSTSQTERDHTDHYELQNLTTMTAGAHAIKFGTRVRDNRDANTTNTYFNGSFNFGSVADFIGAMDAASGIPCPVNPLANDPEACGTTNAPNKLTYYTGNENALGNVFDAALFFQDDWKKSRNLTLSGGVRWESQNHISDHDDWGPRVAFAYALDGRRKGGTPKTVLRGGYGFFFDRLSIGTLMSAIRYNGKPGSQQQIVINSPTCFSATSLSAALAQPGTNCSAAGNLPQIDTIASHYHSPTHEQLGLSLERQLTKSSTLTATYLHTLGVHQEATIDANAYLPGTYVYGSNPIGVRPYSDLGLIDETFPEAVYKQNQLIVSLNARLGTRISVTGFYNLNMANTDTGTASNSYNLAQDYGRASWVSRNQVFLMGNYTGPWGLVFNPFLIAQSGRPYDIATAQDLTGDNFIGQDRPTYATANPLDEVVTTSYGNFNVNPQPGETIIPANLGNGPAAVAMNLRVTRGFGIGPKVEGSGGESPGGGPGGGHGGHFGGFGGPFGAPGGHGPFGGPANSGRKYTLTFSAQALNIFNDIDYGTPNGTVTYEAPSGTAAPYPMETDPRFGQSTSLAGGIFSSGSAARRIFVQAAFQF